MKPCSQTKNHCTCLYGWTLPTGVLYGNVNKRYYVYNPINAVLTVWNGKTWKRADIVNNAHIMHYITLFMKSQGFRMPEKIEVCQHITNLKNAEFSARKEDERFLRSICPREKRAQNQFTRFTGSCYSQSAIDGKGYSNRWEENHVIDGVQVDVYRKKTAIGKDGGSFGYIVMDRPALDAHDPNRNFYVVMDEKENIKAVTITKRDSMKINQTKIRPDKTGGSREFKVSRYDEWMGESKKDAQTFVIRETVTNGKSEVKKI